VTDSKNRVTTMTYDVVNRMATKTLPNGVKTVYSYDDLDRIINLTYTKANGTVLVSETYTRNAGGEPSKVLREDGSYTLYEYDAALRLSKEVVYNPAGGLVESIEYSYDLDGKRTKKVDAAGTHNYNYNANGQLASVGQDGYVYDADGRLQQFNRDGKTVVLSHDAFDHLTQVSVNGVNTQYLYDAQGNRIGEISGGNTKNYLVTPNLGNGLESTDLVTDGNGNVVSDYVYGGSSIIARLDANGDPIYYLTDSMGSVIGLVDGNGDRVSRIIYDGFGEVKSGDDGTSLGGEFRFQGQWLETESGLYYMRARDYDAKTGLFLSRDAIDVQQQDVEAFNPYQFAYNNPFVFSDPSGFFTISELGAAQNIQNTLSASVQRYAGARAKDYVLQKLGDSFGNIVASTFNAFLPGSTALFDMLKQGYDFEDVLKGIVCSYFDGLPLKDNLYIDVKIPNGTPINNGLNCAGNPYGDPRAYQKSISKNGSTPDFMFRNSLPLAYRSGDSGAYLIGDVKLFLGAVRINQRNQTQFENMVKYAKKYQALPFVSYIALSDSNLLPGNNQPQDKGLSKTDRIELARDALSRGIILVLVNIIDK
jgi:RHS repeat-associated protein